MYREHFRLHPDEYEGIRVLKETSRHIDAVREEAQRKKQEKIDYYRGLLNEQSTR